MAQSTGGSGEATSPTGLYGQRGECPRAVRTVLRLQSRRSYHQEAFHLTGSSSLRQQQQLLFGPRPAAPYTSLPAMALKELLELEESRGTTAYGKA